MARLSSASSRKAMRSEKASLQSIIAFQNKPIYFVFGVIRRMSRVESETLISSRSGALRFSRHLLKNAKLTSLTIPRNCKLL